MSNVPNPDSSDEIEALYTDEVIANIAAVVRPFANDEAEAAFPKLIRDWADGQPFFRELDANRDPKRDASIRKELIALAQGACGLAQAIDGLGDHAMYLLAWEAGYVPSNVAKLAPADTDRMRDRLRQTRDVCHELNTLATSKSDTLRPRHGPKSNRARKTAVLGLVAIWGMSTGRKPTRSIDWWDNNRPKSAFHNFCVAALTPIYGDQAEKGLDDIIRRVLKPH